MDQKRIFSPGDRRAFWLAAFDLWRGSSLSVAEFCRQEKLCTKSFRLWRKRFEAPMSSDGNMPTSAVGGVSALARPLFQPLHIVRESDIGVSGTSDAPGPTGPAPAHMEIIVANRRRIVLHGDAFSPTRPTALPHETVLAQVVRILESAASSADASSASSLDAVLHREGR
jgi:hypothetical protein